jgi:hypothetical protein
MAMRAAGVVRAVLLTGAVWLAGAASGWAQAAAEAGALGSTSSSVGGGAAKTMGKSVGSALSGLGAKVESATQTTAPASSAGTSQIMPAGDPAERNGGQPGVDRVVGATPEIHFDASFRRCSIASSSEVELPPEGDSVAAQCMPLSRMIRFAYAGTTSDLSVSGGPAWADTELYELQANVAPEDADAWQKMGLIARKAALRRLLVHELKLRVRVETATQPGKAQADGVVVEHIERPLAD